MRISNKDARALILAGLIDGECQASIFPMWAWKAFIQVACFFDDNYRSKIVCILLYVRDNTNGDEVMI